MTIFLTLFFLVYSLLHTYAFMKAKSVLAFNVKAGILVYIFMVIMILSPVIVRAAEKYGLELFARRLAYFSYTWMALIFLFVSASLCIDIYRFTLYLVTAIAHKDPSALIVSARYAFFIPLLLSLIVVTYGFFEARDIRAETVVLKTSKLPKEVASLTIVQISDVHLGLMVREERLRMILDRVKEARPDLLVITGDLVDGQINGLRDLAEPFNEISPRFGKFAVTGNHEFYAGLDKSLDFMKRAGFTPLRGKGITVARLINIAGVDDLTVEYYSPLKNIREKELLSGLPRENFTLLLKHRPIVDEHALGLFDLQLSGHVHKGQIFPFTIATKLYYPHYAGFATLPRGSALYVSRGSGTWGPPIRVLAPPEVTVIKLIAQ